MRRRQAALALLGALAYPSLARAERVRIGIPATLPYGLDPAHPLPSEHGGDARNGRLAELVPREEPGRIGLVSFAEGRTRGPVIAADGTLYGGTSRGVSALDAALTERWQFEMGAVDACPALLPGGRLLAVGRRGALRVLDLERGALLAAAETSVGVRTAPLVLRDGSFVLAGVDRTLRRFDRDLSERFAVELRAGIAGAATRDAQGRIACAAAGELMRFDPDGVLESSIAVGGRVMAPLALRDDGALLAVLAEGEVVIVSGRRVLHRAQLSAHVYDGATLGVAPDGSARLAVRARGVVALGPSGEERWLFSSDAPFGGPVCVDDEGACLAIDTRGRLTAIESDGTMRWRVQLGGTATLNPPVMNGRGAIEVMLDRGRVESWR